MAILFHDLWQIVLVIFCRRVKLRAVTTVDALFDLDVMRHLVREGGLLRHSGEDRMSLGPLEHLAEHVSPVLEVVLLRLESTLVVELLLGL